MSKLNDLINKLCPDGVKFVKLGETCEVLRGKRLTKKQLSETTEESENKAVALENMIVIKNNYISQLSAEEAKYANDIITMQTEIKKEG